VFDRYGAKVFETNDVNEGWDGKYKGVDQESGIYNYIVRVLSYDDKIRETKGAFELIK
jgi:gliding motility-associated-like protein